MSVRPILCVVGESRSGKTTLLERLIPKLSAAGLKVGVVKHAASQLQAAPANKDSSRLAAAGARPAVVAGPNGVIVQNAERQMHLLDLAENFCRECDLVLAEGYKHSPHDKIVVLSGGDSASGESKPELSSVGLCVADRQDRRSGVVCRDDVATVATWVSQWLDRRRRLGDGVIGAVLTGGLSRRMGRNKAAMRVGGREVLSHLVELLSGRLEEVYVIGHPTPAFLPGCVRWHLDLQSGLGPLSGIGTALRLAACRTLAEGNASGSAERPRAVLTVACDMPALGAEAIDLLLERRRSDRTASALRNPATGRLEPLVALYEPQAQEKIEQALRDKSLSATRLLEFIGACAIDAPAELAGQLVNVNTPEELNALEAPAESGRVK